MECWKCHHPYETTLSGNLSFRAECDKCGADLHCCVNCQYYRIGSPNDCMVPGTEFISDRERNNRCDEFRPKKPGQTQKKADPKDVMKRLFGEE